jgi:hypothetical protein
LWALILTVLIRARLWPQGFDNALVPRISIVLCQSLEVVLQLVNEEPCSLFAEEQLAVWSEQADYGIPRPKPYAALPVAEIDDFERSVGKPKQVLSGTPSAHVV